MEGRQHACISPNSAPSKAAQPGDGASAASGNATAPRRPLACHGGPRALRWLLRRLGWRSCRGAGTQAVGFGPGLGVPVQAGTLDLPNTLLGLLSKLGGQ